MVFYTAIERFPRLPSFTMVAFWLKGGKTYADYYFLCRFFNQGIVKDWLYFIAGNKRLLNFGFLFNFFSAFGQTFFISLFVPVWTESFQISSAAFGTVYATVTIISALILSLSGKYIDHMSLRKFGLIVFTGLIVSVILLSQSYNLVVLSIALLLVRLFGQGLMTHTSSTGMAKYFDINRGKALGFTSLGHPAGQFLIPLVVAALMVAVGWRNSLVVMTVIALLFTIPSIWAIAPVTTINFDKPDGGSANARQTVNYFKTGKFWIITLNIFVVPFIATAIFLYQYNIGEIKGWNMAWVAFSFSFYAISSAVALLLSGNLVDRYSGVRLFPYYILPTLVGLFILSVTNQKWAFPVFYALLGISAGMGSTIKTAVQVEIYGRNSLGKIRSYFSTLLVVSTALGPPVLGYFIDQQFPMNTVFLFFSVAVGVVSILSFKV